MNQLKLKPPIIQPEGPDFEDLKRVFSRIKNRFQEATHDVVDAIKERPDILPFITPLPFRIIHAVAKKRVEVEKAKELTKTTVVEKEQVAKAVASPLFASAPLAHLREYVTIRTFPKVFPSGSGGGDDDDAYLWRAKKFARFAAHAYYYEYSRRILPDHCEIIERHSTQSGLKATLYKHDSQIVCAFAGTSTIKDWEQNIMQIAGVSEQYEDALEYGQNVCKRYPLREIVFVGHSQGGGEAAYCAYNLGKKAETFNPAGLSWPTLAKSNIAQGISINAYVFATDILNAFQYLFGHINGIYADGDVHYVSDVNIFEHGIHGINGILRYFDINYKF